MTLLVTKRGQENHWKYNRKKDLKNKMCKKELQTANHILNKFHGVKKEMRKLMILLMI